MTDETAMKLAAQGGSLANDLACAWVLQRGIKRLTKRKLSYVDALILSGLIRVVGQLFEQGAHSQRSIRKAMDEAGV